MSRICSGKLRRPGTGRVKRGGAWPVVWCVVFVCGSMVVCLKGCLRGWLHVQMTEDSPRDSSSWDCSCSCSSSRCNCSCSSCSCCRVVWLCVGLRVGLMCGLSADERQ